MKMIQDIPLHLMWKKKKKEQNYSLTTPSDLEMKDQKHKKDLGVENMKIIQDLPLHLMWNKKTKSISKTLEQKT